MTDRDEIVRIAHDVGLHIATDVNWMPIIGLKYLEKFAALVAAAEREACAKVCDEWAECFRQVNQDGLSPYAENQAQGADSCAAGIRARGEK